MKILYGFLIASYLNYMYGLLLWGTGFYKVTHLFNQNKAIRLIADSSYISHTNFKKRRQVQTKVIEVILQTILQSLTILF